MRRAFVTLAAALMVSTAALASSEWEKPGEIGVLAGVGLGDDSLVGSDNDTNINPLVGARFGWHFTPRITGFLDGTWVPYDGDPTLFGDVDEYAFRLGPEFHLNPAARWQFFINVGVGFMQLKPDVGDSDGVPFASLGLGMRRGYNPGALRFELRGDQTVSDADGLGGEKFTALKAMVGWTWGIGGRPTDEDGDGVYDKKDKCPGTPQGCTVDQAGCPLDGDGDGVCDGLDRCPDTPKGWAVDASGCNKDSDGDGVADGADKCPDTAKGCKVGADGCPADADGDGVCDGLDQCPNTPKGCRVDAKGCPLDSDADGVCDGVDTCPGTARGVKVDAKGCPPPAPPPPAFIPEPKKELVLDRVYFETNSAKLKPESFETLDKVAASIKEFPDVKILVAGHTDSTGSDAYNLKLSANRANSVLDYLVSKGVPRTQLAAGGFGEKEPIADNKTAEGRAKNRRVGLRRVE
jgi:outer membrane protein OmpA-like peptidoglycan-associated protein